MRAERLGYELALAFLALVSVAIGAWEVTHPRPEPGFTWLDWLDLSIVAVFVVDFAVEARRRGSVRAYARENWWELPSLVPITGGVITALEGFSIVRVLRLARLVRVLRLLRLAGVAARLRATSTYFGRLVRRSRAVQLFAFAALVVAAGTAAGWFAERGANPRFEDPDDAAWWALNMFTNVAYVDFQPATPAGRVIAAVLEVLGIAFIGVFAGSVANALLKEPEPSEEDLS